MIFFLEFSGDRAIKLGLNALAQLEQISLIFQKTWLKLKIYFVTTWY